MTEDVDAPGALAVAATRRRSQRLAAVAIVVVLALVWWHPWSATSTYGPGAPGQTPGSTTVSYTYGCCTAHLVDTVYHPGDVLQLRWTRIAEPAGQGGSFPKSRITLVTWISGPYRTVASLKASSVSGSPVAGVATTRAASISVSNRTPASPVSLIRIRVDATPGYYNLVSRVSSAGIISSGATVIRVVGR